MKYQQHSSSLYHHQSHHQPSSYNHYLWLHPFCILYSFRILFITMASGRSWLPSESIFTLICFWILEHIPKLSTLNVSWNVHLNPHMTPILSTILVLWLALLHLSLTSLTSHREFKNTNKSKNTKTLFSRSSSGMPPTHRFSDAVC